MLYFITVWDGWLGDFGYREQMALELIGPGSKLNITCEMFARYFPHSG